MSVCGKIVRKISWFERQGQIAANTVCELETFRQCAKVPEDYKPCVDGRKSATRECAEKKDLGRKECTKTKVESYEKCDEEQDQSYKECTQEKDDSYKKCSQEQDQSYEDCTQKKDQGYDSCSQKQDQGHNECCGWWPCSWACDAYYWVANVVCVAWTWVTNVVCVAWAWVKNVVCVGWTWVSHVVCVVWTWVKNVVCVWWTWVQNIVCVVYTWVANVVCVVWAYTKSVACIAWDFAKRWVCKIIYYGFKGVCRFFTGVGFWFARRFLEAVTFFPCKGRAPDLDDRIKHVFVLVLENRSYDHMLGATAISGTDAVNGGKTDSVNRKVDAVNDVADAEGKFLGRHMVGVGQMRSVGFDPGHEFGNTMTALCGHQPKTPYPPYPPIDNSGYAQNLHASRPEIAGRVMLSYRTPDIPVLASLAREFVICDHWFSSVPGPTWPNRLFIHAASSAGLDDSPTLGDSLIDSLASGIVFENGTIFDLVASENIDWAVYHDDAFPQVLSLAGMDLPTITSHFHPLESLDRDLADGSVANYVFIEPDYGDEILDDSYLCGNSQHPLDDITHGERLIKRVYESIRNSPVWEESMLIITYDEGGGFYDHMIPPKAVPPGDAIPDQSQNYNGFDFTQLGARVPAVVCSPWIPRNVIDHRVYDHTSIASTVEHLWGLPPMTDRDAAARSLDSLLTLRSPRTDAPTHLPDAARSNVTCSDRTFHDLLVSPVLHPRVPNPTLLGPMTLARAQQENPKAITSTASAFFQVAVRRDMLMAPPSERAAILAQSRRLQTMGEVALYTRKVGEEAQRQRGQVRNLEGRTRS